MRDNFSAKTIEMLAKRVAYKCCNPDCKRPTIGPNSDPSKATLIGVAAHITAASIGGPRYDQDLTNEARASISNAIWLCQNCSTLIDRDISTYTIELLKSWKINAENKAFKDIQQGNYEDMPKADAIRPYAEAELIWVYSFKTPHGLSEKTYDIYGDKPIAITQAIWFNNISWDYELKIYNNSSVGLYNIKVHLHPSSGIFYLKETPPKINNIPPYQDLALRAGMAIYFEGTSEEAEEVMKPSFPDSIQGLRLLLEYSGEDRSTYFTELTLKHNELEIVHCHNKPAGY